MLFELKKCLQKKHIMCIILFLLIWGLLIPAALTYLYWNVNISSGYSGKEDVVRQIEEISGNDLYDIQKRVRLEQEETVLKNGSKSPILIQYLYESPSQKISEVLVMQEYREHGVSDLVIRKLQEHGRPRSVSSVKNKIPAGESRIYSKQLAMLEAAGKPGSEFNTFMKYYENFGNISVIVIMTFLIFFFSNTGSREYSSRMDLLIFSSPLGAKKIIANKMMASAATGVLPLLLVDLLHFLIFLVLGYGANLGIGLNCLSPDFTYSPYNISVGQYFIFKILMQTLTVILTAVLLVLCSLISRSSAVSIAIVGSFTLGGYALAVMGFDSSIPVRYSMAPAMVPQLIFKDFYALGIGEAVILYPFVYAAWIALIAGCSLCVFKLYYKK